MLLRSWLHAAQGPVPVFPDLITRTIVSSLPEVEDFRVVEHEPGRWSISMRPLPGETQQRLLIQRCVALAERLGAAAPDIELSQLVPAPRKGKQRRILGVKSQACAS